ncbi:TetR/AcrR family transcriptional regulator [Pseudonocardia sp. ICBG1293]|jgi:TetR/AcrR family tetracycline transcriptional repressor|uniref:TetR/AcrR family transcriptional regulator n=1 Tax=Pseudonocardia sp. ICBG1293 TaxID=2844382 RepID=UPI001CCDAA25|nr:TetR family transcriptional regulator [Pseudonocardia sp. ICBG1293]
MGRRPLITRDGAARAALEIVDEGGPAALSLERLAAALSVRAPSLYNHFADKAEILAEVARIIVLDTPRVPDPEPGRWQEWLVEETTLFRRSLLQHPRAVPLVVEHLPQPLLVRLYQQYSRLLAAHGVPERMHLFLLEAAHRMAIGSAISTANGRAALQSLDPGTGDGPPVAPDDEDERRFVEMVRTFLRGVDREI